MSLRLWSLLVSNAGHLPLGVTLRCTIFFCSRKVRNRRGGDLPPPPAVNCQLLVVHPNCRRFTVNRGQLIANRQPVGSCLRVLHGGFCTPALHGEFSLYGRGLVVCWG